MEKKAARTTTVARAIKSRAAGKEEAQLVPRAAPRKRASPASRGSNDRKGGAPSNAVSRPYHHGNLREDLVRCGKEQLREVGLADLSLRRIASEVGVSQVAPKHHFGNKEGLLAAIAASGFRDLTEFRYSRLRPNMSPEQRLRTLLSAYVAFATLNPTIFHLMFAPQFKAPEAHSELNEAASQSYQIVARAAADYLAARGKADEIDPHMIARVAWMCMHGVATLIIENRINPLGATKVSRDQLTSQALDLLFAGIEGLHGL